MWSSLAQRFANAFAIDLRSLAYFRMALGLIVAWNLWGRMQLRPWVIGPLPGTTPGSDAQENLAILPSQLSQAVWTPWHWSVLWMDQYWVQFCSLFQPLSLPDPSAPPVAESNLKQLADHSTAQAVADFFSSGEYADGVFIVGIIAALLFSAGLLTKASTFVLWVIVLSVQHRMPLFSSGADTLEKLFLFWLMFLPAGAVCSLDAYFFPRQGFWRKRIHQTQMAWQQTNAPAGNAPAGNAAAGNAATGKLAIGHASPAPLLSISNLATAALLLQLVGMYFFAGLAKWNADWWSGQAIAQALSWNFYTKPAAEYFLAAPAVLSVVTWLVLWIELTLPLLIFCPGLFGWTRRPAICFLIAMHIGIALTMSIGTFSIISICGWILLANVRSPRWGNWKNWRSAWIDRRDQSQIQAGRLHNSPRSSATAVEILVAVLLLMTFAWNVSALGQAGRLSLALRPLKPLLCNLGLEQNFPMFGRIPQQNWAWYHGLEDGSPTPSDPDRVSLRQHLPSPLNVSNRLHGLYETHSVFLWRQLHINLIYSQDQHPAWVDAVRQRLRRLEFATWRKSEHGFDASDSRLQVIDLNSDQTQDW